MTVAQGKLILPRTHNCFYIISDYLCSVSLKLHYLKCVKSKWCHCFYSLSLLECHLIYYFLIPFPSLFPSLISFLACQTVLQNYQTCFPIEVTALRSQPGFAALVRKTLAVAWRWIPRQTWLPPSEGYSGEKSKGVFMQVLIQIGALGVFLVFLPYKRFHRFIHFCSTNCCLVSEVAREMKVFNKGGM